MIDDENERNGTIEIRRNASSTTTSSQENVKNNPLKKGGPGQNQMTTERVLANLKLFFGAY